MKAIANCFFFLCITFSMHAQRGNNWVFGSKAIINFSTTPPGTGVSAMHQLEGSSSISDLAGNLLFYSDGIKVWNRQHQVMPNGTGLSGHYSSSQSSMIVPFPADANRYYIFTVDAMAGPKGLCYFVVNMALDNGNGDIELKNIQLITPTAEKITSVNHCNGKDVWVMAHHQGSDKIYAYLVTAAGVSAPVISSTGTTGNPIGYLKASPDGTRLVNANTYGGGLQLYDFNAATGQVSNKKEIYPASPDYLGPYGVEFSPDCRLLYVTHCRRSTIPNWFHSELRQYNFLDSSVTKINASKTVIDQDSIFFTNNHFAALQIGPDGKIYHSIFATNTLSVVNEPNLAGISCNYTRYAQPLAVGTSARFGLPDFNQSYFKGSFTHTSSCTTTAIDFYYSKPNNASFVKWDFGDPATGINNSAITDSPSHVFSVPGIYTVTLVVGLSCRNDTLSKVIKIDPLFTDLGPDKSICNDSLLILDPQSGNTRTYLWQDNSTNPTLTASVSGLYWVEVTNPENGCKQRDSILVTRKPNPAKVLGTDTILCERNDLLLDAGNPGAKYLWQDNSTNQTLLVREAGQYRVKINLNGCVASDTIQVVYKRLPRVYLGNDTAICPGMNITLRPYLNYAEQSVFTWSTGETTPGIQVSQPGMYSLEVRNECGVTADGILVKAGVCRLYMPTAFTPNNDGRNDILKPGYGENVSTFTMEVYNRWGQRIFVSNKIQDGWDGKYKGQLQPAGVYTWLLRYKVTGETKEYTQQGTAALLY